MDLDLAPMVAHDCKRHVEQFGENPDMACGAHLGAAASRHRDSYRDVKKSSLAHQGTKLILAGMYETFQTEKNDPVFRSEVPDNT